MNKLTKGLLHIINKKT